MIRVTLAFIVLVVCVFSITNESFGEMVSNAILTVLFSAFEMITNFLEENIKFSF